MWDFSWLERRWPGAGYEDWDIALDELVERGYDSVRIDPYPHLVGVDPTRDWTLLPVWNQHAWGAPDRITVTVFPALTTFIAKCGDRGIGVALSSWFRDDTTNARMTISSPRKLAEYWRKTLDILSDAGLLSSILYVDLCNEYPLQQWAPWLYGTESPRAELAPSDELSRWWMTESIKELRQHHPTVPYCFSCCSQFANWRHQDPTFMNLLEPHLWMTQPDCSDFYSRLNYRMGEDCFDPIHFTRLAQYGVALYRSNPQHWQQTLATHIANTAQWSSTTGLPLVTTEGWAIISYKDWPGLDWGWVKELNEFGVKTALSTGRWAALATSNFCGPQFRGMWRDVPWHKQMTKQIKETAPEVPIPTRTNERIH
jgi:hypothetical protein